MIGVLAAAVGAALGSNVLTRFLVPRLEAHRVLDIPKQRSSHSGATVRGAGLAAAVVWCASGVVILLLGGSQRSGVVAAVGLAIGLTVLGFWDDMRSLSAVARLAVQAVLCSGAAVLGVRTDFVTFPGLGSLPLGILAIPLCAVVLLTMVNFFNFMDGIDGLAIGQTLVGAAVLLAGALLLKSSTVTLLAAALAGVAAGFLPFNWNPARCFMGDAGSYFCGGTLGALLILGQRSGIPFLLVGLANVGFLADATITLTSRLLKGDKVWEAHHSHFYQRLVASGRSHAQVTLLYMVIASALGAVAVLYLVQTQTVH